MGEPHIKSRTSIEIESAMARAIKRSNNSEIIKVREAAAKVPQLEKKPDLLEKRLEKLEAKR